MQKSVLLNVISMFSRRTLARKPITYFARHIARRP